MNVCEQQQHRWEGNSDDEGKESELGSIFDDMRKAGVGEEMQQVDKGRTWAMNSPQEQEESWGIWSQMKEGGQRWQIK